MAHTHALTFFVAKGMIDAGAATDVPFAPPSFQAISRTIETVRSDGGHLFAAIARDNPFAAEARKELVRALAAIDVALDADAAEETTEATRRFAIPDLGARSPELKETRDHIDAVDAEIVRLLGAARAARPARGSGQGGLGAPVLDGPREAELIAIRREWASESKIDPDAVADVFRAVLTMSRRAQHARIRSAMPPNLGDGRFRDHAANERTMLAWLRTGIALMAFGFAIARFALFLRQLTEARGEANTHAIRGLGSTWFGVALVVLGLVTNAAATIRYEVNRRALEADRPVTPSPVLVYVIGVASVILGATMAAVLGVTSP